MNNRWACFKSINKHNNSNPRLISPQQKWMHLEVTKEVQNPLASFLHIFYDLTHTSSNQPTQYTTELCFTVHSSRGVSNAR